MTGPTTAPRGRRTWPQRAILAVNAIIVVAALGTAVTLGYLNTKLAHLQRLSLGQVLTPTEGGPGTPQNYLLVGTDDARGLATSDPALAGRGNVTGARSDTIMILHVDPAEARAVLLSLPRDLWVTIAGTGTKQKINAAIQVGGAPTLIKTIEENFQIPINHYVEIDFAGFKHLVSAVDGIPIYINVPFRYLYHTCINI
jgi:anionic cell wall polymer biosynthesis LytR-Cps2A-Psr (LCP) family protein